MFVIIPIFLLIAIAVVMVVLRFARPKFTYFWLLAAITALLAWPTVLLSRLSMMADTKNALSIPLGHWQPLELFPVSPALLVDSISWPFALSLATLLLATILTDVARTPNSDSPSTAWSDWTSNMAMTALGLVATLASNLLTVVLAWTAIDLFEVVIWLGKAKDRATTERVMIAFTSRVASIALVIWAGMVANASETSLTFPIIAPRINIYLLIAAGLRLGISPRYFPHLKALPMERGLATVLHLIPVASGLVLLARTAAVGVSPDLSPYLLFLAGLVALYGGLSWAMASNEVEGQPFWTLGLAALALACAVQAQPAASLAWGIALLLPGGLILLFSARHRRFLPLLLLGLLGISSLPFTPTWQGVRLYTQPSGSLVFFLIAQGALLAGYAHQALRPGKTLAGVERWVWIIYPWGLSLLPMTQLAITWWIQPGSSGALQTFPTWQESWPGIVTTVIAVLLTIWNLRGPQIPSRLTAPFRNASPLAWLYRLLWGIYHFFGRVLPFISKILEGQAGILWALLLLILLLSLFTQIGMGG